MRAAPLLLALFLGCASVPEPDAVPPEEPVVCDGTVCVVDQKLLERLTMRLMVCMGLEKPPAELPSGTNVGRR